jgi:hypothetical protein
MFSAPIAAECAGRHAARNSREKARPLERHQPLSQQPIALKAHRLQLHSSVSITISHPTAV